MEGFACIGTAALDLQMGENQVQNLFVQYSCWKIINILIASSFISESFSEYLRLLFLEMKNQSWWAVSSSLEDENREIFGERRKIEDFLSFSWVLLLLLWKNMLSGLSPIISLPKITVRKASAAFSPLISQNWNTCTRQKVYALQRRCCSSFSPSLVRRSMGRWGTADGWGLPGQRQRYPGETDWDGSIRVCAGNPGTSDTEGNPSRHLAGV